MKSIMMKKKKKKEKKKKMKLMSKQKSKKFQVQVNDNWIRQSVIIAVTRISEAWALYKCQFHQKVERKK